MELSHQTRGCAANLPALTPRTGTQCLHGPSHCTSWKLYCPFTFTCSRSSTGALRPNHIPSTTHHSARGNAQEHEGTLNRNINGLDRRQSMKSDKGVMAVHSGLHFSP